MTYTSTILLVQGCDHNSWIWPYWYEYFRRAWDFDCGIDVVMICENHAPDYPGVKSFRTIGAWSSRQRAFLVEHPEVEHIVYAVEDQLLMEPVRVDLINRLIVKMKRHDVKFVLLNDDKYMHSQVVQNRRPDDRELIRISYAHRMLLWLQAGIIDSKFYGSILEHGKNAWETEAAAHEKIRSMGVKTCMYVDRPVFRYREVLRRGELKPHRMKYLWAVDAGDMFPAGDQELDRQSTKEYYQRWKDKIDAKTVLEEWVK